MGGSTKDICSLSPILPTPYRGALRYACYLTTNSYRTLDLDKEPATEFAKTRMPMESFPHRTLPYDVGIFPWPPYPPRSIFLYLTTHTHPLPEVYRPVRQYLLVGNTNAERTDLSVTPMPRVSRQKPRLSHLTSLVSHERNFRNSINDKDVRLIYTISTTRTTVPWKLGPRPHQTQSFLKTTFFFSTPFKQLQNCEEEK